MMDAQWWWRTFYIGLTYLAIISAGEKCGGGCKGGSGDSVFSFEDGTVYRYDVEGLSLTQLVGSSNDVSKLSIKATAEVSAQSDCTYVLKLSNVQVAGTDGKKYDDLSADCSKPVKFNFNNGELSPEICTENDDDGAALNIKRAVISLFQSSSAANYGSDRKFTYETDVFGSCPTTYQFSTVGSKIQVGKTRNLNRCANREKFDFPVLSTPYYTYRSDLQTSPLMLANLEVLQEIESGILKAASGEEKYEYRPILTAEALATIHNKFTLSFAGSSKGLIPANGNQKQSIIFETPHPRDGAGSADAIIKALQKVVSEIDPAVEESAANSFLELVDELEHTSKGNILTVYSQIKSGAGFNNKEVAKNLLLDGLLYAGSAESVEAAAELLRSHEISEEGSLKWYLDLNFVKHVSKGSIKAVTPLLEGKPPHQAYLGIGALAGKYCRQHDCANVPEFQQLLQKLAKPVNDGCRVNSVEEENNVIASLKGLANVQVITDSVAGKLSQCAEDTNVRTRIRSAALSAYRENPVLKKSAIKIFKDIDEDAELRIKAYLALVEKSYPCGEVADVVKETIDKEVVNQVGSYVVSHLRNLRATTNPNKDSAKYCLGQIIPKKRFPFDIRKFSHNRELSYSFDALNIGAVGEADTIYSQKSYLPRYVSLNLTSNIFGHSFNFLEVAARAENLEYLVEKYFGPNGQFTNSPNDVVEETAEAGEHYYGRYKNAQRNKRSITQQQINNVAKKVKLGVDYEDRSVDIDLSLKLFGAEVGWLKLNGDKSSSVQDFLNKLTGRFEESVNKLKNYEVDYKKARNFMDVTVSYPTVLGLALKFKVLGGSAANIKVDSKLNIQEIIEAIKNKNTDLNTDIKLQVIPSVAVEVTSIIAIDADIIQTGIKATANLHSSTGTDVTLRILDGSGVDLKVGLPVKNQELVSFKTNAVSIVRERGHKESSSKINFNTQRTNYKGCFDQLSPFIGLTACGEIDVPAERYLALSPAYGPSKLLLRIEKEDESLSSYHFKAYYNNKDPNVRSLEVILDTPNSRSDRKLALVIQARNDPRLELSVSALSPWKSISLEGYVTDTNSEQSITAKLINDNQVYSLRAGATVSGDENRKKYEPLLEYKEPEGGKQWAMVGRKGGVKGGKSQQSLGVTGAVIVEKKPGTKYRKYELKSVTVSAHSVKFTVDGDVTIDKNSFETDLTVSYDKNSVKFNSKLQCTGDKIIAEVDFIPEQSKELSASLRWNFEKAKHKLANSIVLVHGPDLKSEEAKFSLSQSLEYNFESYKTFEFETKNSLSYPLLNVIGKFDLELSPKEIELDFKAGYDVFNVESTLEAKTGIKDVGDYNIEFSAKLLKSIVQLTARHDIISDVKSKFTNSLELKPGGKYQLNAIVVYDFKGKDINQAIEAEVKIPFEPKIIKLSTALKNNRAESSVVFILIGGGKPIIEIKGALEKSSKPEGNFKVYIPNYIDSSGSYSFDGNKGLGSFSLEFPKTSRQVAGKGEVFISGLHYKGFGEVQWDAKRNPSKKIRIDTDTSYSENSVDSKNSLQILDYKTLVNVKGNLQGKLSDGTLIGETELGLPSGRILTFKINRELHLKPGDNEIEGTYELCNYESKGTQPQKLVFKISGKNIDPKTVSFDGQADLSYTTQKQENVILHVVGKKVPHGDKWIIAGEGSISGSLVHSVKVKLDSEVSDLLLKGDFSNKSQLPPAQYHFTASDAASGVTFSLDGKINGYQFNNDLDLKLPSDFPITSLKWTTINFLNYHPQKGQLKQVKYNNAVTWNGDKFVKVNIESTSDITKVLDSYGKLEWESHVASLRTLTGRIKQEREEDKTTVTLDGAFTFEGKTADINVKLIDYGTNTIHAIVVANVPSKGKFTADLKSKEERPSETVYIRDFVLVLTGDDKTLKVTHHLENRQSDLFLMKFLVEAPQGKSGVDIKSVKKGVRKYEIQEKFYWISGGGGNLDLDIDFDFGDLKDVSFKIAADSKKLSINKFEFEGSCKAAVKTSGKRLVFSAKTATSELFSGSLLYQVEDKLPGSLSFAGNGVLRTGDKTYPLKVNLDYEYSLAEATFVLSLDAKPYSWLSQIKRENPEQILVNFDVLHKFCKDAVCSKVELGQKYEEDKNSFSSFTISRHLYIDLDALVYESKVIDYKSLYKQQGPYFDYKIVSSYGTYRSEYHSYVKEQEAGTVLTLPSRVIALEITHDISVSKQAKALPGSFEITFYPNKKNPDEKTCLSFKSDLSTFLKNEATGPFNTELRFAAPGIRDLILKAHGQVSKDYGTVEGTVDIDVFNKKPNRIVIDYKRTSKQVKNDISFDQTLKVHSKGQEIDFQSHQILQITKDNVVFHSIGHYIDAKKVKQEGEFKLEANDENQVLFVKIPEGVLISFNGKTTTTKDGYTSDYNYEFLGKKVSEKITLNKNNFKYVGHYGKDVFVEEFGFAYGQMAEFKASLNNKLLASFEVMLDDVNFLKSTYNYDVDTIKALIESVKTFDLELYSDYAKTSKAAIERVSNELADRSEELRKSSPNFKPVFNAYAAQWKKLKEELENDESFKEAISAFKKVRGVVIDQIIEVYQETSKALNSLLEVINETWEKINEVVKKLIPKFSDAFSRVTDTVKLLIEEFYKISTQTVNNILDEVKKHDEEVKEMIGLVTDFIHEMGLFLSRSTQQIQIGVKEILFSLKEQFEACPITAIITKKVEELGQYQVPEHVFSMYAEFVKLAKQSAPTQETQIFIDCVAKYIEKIIKHQPVDDEAELEQIYKNFVAALRSLVALYNPKNPDAPFDPLYELIEKRIFHPLQFYHPSRGTFRLSLIQLLQSPDLPSLSEFYQTYKPTRYILDYFPPYTAYATFTDATEIVTFDGQQLSFKGSCGYILVQDYVDGNFSVAASLENGKVKALIISDRDNIVELHSDRSVIVNGKPNEFPVVAGDITVWRKYHSFGAYVNGLKVFCVDNLEHCNFILSGFYFSKTRGLLGTYNNEPYDDLTAPAGNICGSSSEFGNAWKTNAQCSDVPQSVHNHVHTDDCTEYFTTGSPLQSCFSAVDPLSFRKSCDHKVQETQGNKQEVICKFVESYIGLCLIKGISIKLPNECYSCKAGSHTLKPGETVSINTPQNSADIVIVVEELEFNEEVYSSLILPLIPLLTNDLKGRGITDVKFALIGFGAPGDDWPAHYTTNGDIEFNGKSKISFSKLENNTSRGQLVEKIKFLKKQFDIEFGLTPFSKVIEELMNYPFRAEAVKSVLSVYAKPCEDSALPISTLPIKSLAGSIAVTRSGIKLNVITPLKDLEIEGKVPKAAANIVGFDSEAVYMQGEAKRKVLRGDEETFKNLKYSNDGCIDFAQSVDGAVFSSNNFIQGKPGLRKNFLQVLSEKITEDLTGVAIEQECWCELERFFPITRCKVESRREKELLAKTVKGGVKG